MKVKTPKQKNFFLLKNLKNLGKATLGKATFFLL